MENLVGRSLGRYHIIEQLGRGGMATVFKAFDTSLNRNVAIKVILSTKKYSGEFLRRFEREAQAIAQLSHNNIVKVYDFGEQDGTPFLVMEFLSGGMLKDIMGSPMPYKKATRLLIPIADALGYAHERKIVHRDVKPSNIMLTESGQPMLTDFGIAKMLEEKDATSLTAAGVGIGTPEYMAPEQGMGQHVDYRADIYSLGMVFYELVTGQKPFQADTPFAVMMKQMTQTLPRPKSFVPNLPDEVEQILFKALAKQPADRYQDMASFAMALRKLVEPQPVKMENVVKRPSSFYITLGVIGLILICGVAAGALFIGGAFGKIFNLGVGTPNSDNMSLTGTWQVNYSIAEVILGPETNPHACEYMTVGDAQVYQMTLVQDGSGQVTGYAGSETEHLCSAEINGEMDGDEFTLIFTYKQTGCCKGLSEQYSGKMTDKNTLEGSLLQTSQSEEKCCFAAGKNAISTRNK